MVKKTKKDDVHETPVSQNAAADEKQKDESAEGSDKELALRLREKEKEAADNYDKYVRAVAELENYRKRAAREKADTIKYGNENLLRDILPMVDSMDRALDHASNSDDFAAFKEGLKLIHNQLLCVLEKHGVTRVECSEQDFDPNVHEAMMQVDSAEHENNKVVCEFEKGYLLNGRLLRPAKVSVCKRVRREDTPNVDETGKIIEIKA